MRNMLIVGLMLVGLFVATPVIAAEASKKVTLPTVDIRTIAVILQDGDYEVVVPLYNIISVKMDRKDKVYKVYYYGYYNDSGRSLKISKGDYERLKRLLIKSEQ